MRKNKVLIIRFSSFGDIVQCSSVVELVRRNYPNAEIHWVTRSEFSELVGLNQEINKVIVLNKNSGISGLLKLIKILKNENYDLIYDAHNNLRSTIIHLFFLLNLTRVTWITRSKNRFKRILLFKFRINLLPHPFKGIESFINPLKNKLADTTIKSQLVKYNFNEKTELKVRQFIKNGKKNVTIVPSAAWPMKRWPLEHWKNLVSISTDYHFYILGGKDDSFCADIMNIATDRVTNLAGELSLIESCCFIKNSDVVISADTGLLHVADVLGKKGIALTGPTAFGYTTSPLIQNLEIDLLCRPCSKDGSGKCSQAVYQRCMVEIAPQNVQKTLDSIF